MYYNYIILNPEVKGKFYYENLNFSLLYEPLYIGKGKGNRYKKHLLEIKSVNKHKFNKIKKLNLKFSMLKYILLFNFTQNELHAYENEKNLISSIGRFDLKTGPLLNLCDGGIGGISNRIIKKTSLKKLSDSLKMFYKTKEGILLKQKKSIKLKNQIHSRGFCFSKKQNETKSFLLQKKYLVEPTIELKNYIIKTFSKKKNQIKYCVLFNNNLKIEIYGNVSIFCKLFKLSPITFYKILKKEINNYKNIISINIISNIISNNVNNKKFIGRPKKFTINFNNGLFLKLNGNKKQFLKNYNIGYRMFDKILKKEINNYKNIISIDEN